MQRKVLTGGLAAVLMVVVVLLNVVKPERLTEERLNAIANMEILLAHSSTPQ